MENTQIHFTDKMLKYLLSASKWAKTLSILYFIVIFVALFILILLGIVYNSNLFSSGLENQIGIFYVILIIIQLFPIWYLFKFATKMKKAILNNHNTSLEISFNYLRKYYKFIVILTIIGTIGVFISSFLISLWIHDLRHLPLAM